MRITASSAASARAGLEPAPGPLGRRRVQILLPARSEFRREPEDQHLPEPVRPHSRKPAAFLFRLAGDAGYEPELQGAGELPERPAAAARLFRGRIHGESAAQLVRRGQQILEQLEPRRAGDAAREQFLRPGRAAAGREAHRLAAAGV